MNCRAGRNIWMLGGLSFTKGVHVRMSSFYDVTRRRWRDAFPLPKGSFANVDCCLLTVGVDNKAFSFADRLIYDRWIMWWSPTDTETGSLTASTESRRNSRQAHVTMVDRFKLQSWWWSTGSNYSYDYHRQYVCSFFWFYSLTTSQFWRQCGTHQQQ